MKKLISLLLAICLTACLCAGALADGITVSKRDLAQNRELSRDVTNILFLMQNEGVTDTMMIASINSSTGRSVMTRVDCALEVEVQGAGTHPIGEVYAMGAKGSEGLLAVRTVNQWLGLNIDTYVALDMSFLPNLVEKVGALRMTLDKEEAAALGLSQGANELSGEQTLQYIQLHLDSDSPALSRSYNALMQLLYQGVHDDLMSLAMSLLSSMDTNMNPFGAIPLVTAVQGGDDRRELALNAQTAGDAQDVAQALRDAFYREVYE